MEQTLFRLLLTTKLKAQQAHCHKNTGQKAQRDHHLNQLNNGLKAQRDHSPGQRPGNTGQRPGNTGQRPGNTCESIMNALKEQKK